MLASFAHEELKSWFLSARRDLPWRNQPSPYAVWVSEVMLQQTQVSVVIPYFENWMKRFPDIHSLAEASLDEVIKLWEGLGYYSRARNLHEGAKFVLKEFQGILPKDAGELKKIKGLGPYTIGALRSFAFHEKAAAVDGNVVRVLARYFLIEGDVSKGQTNKEIWKLAEAILPEEIPWLITEALIELGATICVRKPQCLQCPLKKSCAAYKWGMVDELPYKSGKMQIEKLYRAVAVVQCDDSFLVRRGKRGEIMGDLHEFPYFETKEKGLTERAFTKKLGEAWKLTVKSSTLLPQEKQAFTRYQVRLDPVHFVADQPIFVEGCRWLAVEELKKLAFSSGHRRIFEGLVQKGK